MRHVHRKVFLPTYGLFDERRFFAPGSTIRAVTSERLGLRLGISVCEDFWHLATPQLLALDGAQLLINVSSSPGRDVAAVNESGLGTATSWRTLNRTYAQLTTSYVIFVNRVGVDESITFWGGSEVVSPIGPERLRVPRPTTRASTSLAIDPVEVRRERIATPLLRDERPEVVMRQLDQIMRERLERSRAAQPTAVMAAIAAELPAFELPPELAIDTAAARRIIASSSVRSCARPASARRCWGSRAASTRPWWPTWWPMPSVLRNLLAVLMPYRTSSPESRADAEEVVRRLGCASELVDISPIVDGYFEAGREDATPAATGQLHGPDAHDGALRPLGDLERSRGGHRQQDRDAHRLQHALG